MPVNANADSTMPLCEFNRTSDPPANTKTLPAGDAAMAVIGPSGRRTLQELTPLLCLSSCSGADTRAEYSACVAGSILTEVTLFCAVAGMAVTIAETRMAQAAGMSGYVLNTVSSLLRGGNGCPQHEKQENASGSGHLPEDFFELTALQGDESVTCGINPFTTLSVKAL